MSNKFSGTGVALVTPFDGELNVDYQALEKLVKHVSDGGVDYLVVMGTTGESPTLSAEEKVDILRFVISKNERKLPIVYGMGGNSTRDLVNQYKNFKEEVDAFLVVCPYYNRPSQRGLQLHFEAIAGVAPKPIILYNVPKRTGCNMEVDTVLALANHSNIIGIKEASGSAVVQAEEIARKIPSDFLMTSGDDELILPFIKAGGQGVISVIANALPKQTSTLVQEALSGFNEQAADLAQDLGEMLNLIFLEGNPTGVKSLLKKLGIGNGRLRLPLVEASMELAQKIEGANKKIA